MNIKYDTSEIPSISRKLFWKHRFSRSGIVIFEIPVFLRNSRLRIYVYEPC